MTEFLSDYAYFKNSYEAFKSFSKLTPKIKKEMQDLIRQFNNWYAIEADKGSKEVKQLKSDYYNASLLLVSKKDKMK